MTRSAAFLALLGLVLTPAAARPEELVLDVEVAGQMVIEGCGGLLHACREYLLEGRLELRLDNQIGVATLAAADLRISEDGLPSFPLELPLSEISGAVDGQTIRFATAPQSLQTLEWTMTLVAGGLVLQGTFDEGCCDRFVFSFRNVALMEAEGAPSTVLRLGGGRFTVEARWTDFDGQQGAARAVALNADSGTFWFFDADNTELVVKVLDGCEIFDTYWFFAAGLTDVGVELTVRDLEGGVEQRYESPVGEAFQPILDTAAFATCETAGSSGP